MTLLESNMSHRRMCVRVDRYYRRKCARNRRCYRAEPISLSSRYIYRLICALGQQSSVTVLTRCQLPLPVYLLADEKHSRCLTDRVYLPTIVSGRVLWHLGYSEAKSATAFTASYEEFQRVASQEDPSYQVKGALTDGFDSTTSSMRTLFP